MRVSLIGSILIFCTPIFSVVVVTLILPLMNWYLYYLPPYQSIQPGIGWNLSTMVFFAIGIGLYVYGSLKQQTHTETITFSPAIAGALLALYGLFTCFLAFAYQTDAVTRLTPQALAEYNKFILTWGLKGFVWLLTGLAFFVQATLRYMNRQWVAPKITD